jgi:hypothetical protein
MTLTKEPVAPAPTDLWEEAVEIERPPVRPEGRIRWFEWAIGVAVLIVLSLSMIMVATRGEVPEITLVLGPRHSGVVFVPEYVGQSGGDLPAIESSPLSMGVRHTEGIVFVPEYVGYADGVYPEDSR